jgi:hypothetical protein
MLQNGAAFPSNTRKREFTHRGIRAQGSVDELAILPSTTGSQRSRRSDEFKPSLRAQFYLGCYQRRRYSGSDHRHQRGNRSRLFETPPRRQGGVTSFRCRGIPTKGLLTREIKAARGTTTIAAIYASALAQAVATAR